MLACVQEERNLDGFTTRFIEVRSGSILAVAWNLRPIENFVPSVWHWARVTRNYTEMEAYFYEIECEWRDSQNQSLFFSRGIPRRVIRLRSMNFREISFIFYLSIDKHAWKVHSARIFLCRRFSSMNNNWKKVSGFQRGKGERLRRERFVAFALNLRKIGLPAFRLKDTEIHAEAVRSNQKLSHLIRTLNRYNPDETIREVLHPKHFTGIFLGSGDQVGWSSTSVGRFYRAVRESIRLMLVRSLCRLPSYSIPRIAATCTRVSYFFATFVFPFSELSATFHFN